MLITMTLIVKIVKVTRDTYSLYTMVYLLVKVFPTLYSINNNELHK